jgi:2'-5' RNA ligase
VFSLNVPVPPAVEALARDLAPELAAFEARPARTLLLKRLGGFEDHHRAEHLAREALRGAPAVEARVSTIGVFEDPPAGPAPVVYLAVESPGLQDLHRRLCEVIDPVPGLEGEGYVPHVTLARGLPGERLTGQDAAAELDGRTVGPVTWAAEELRFYDARHAEPAGRIALPAR